MFQEIAGIEKPAGRPGRPGKNWRGMPIFFGNGLRVYR
jgi:hypothetical protein